MEKKAFTLIELLAVITIISIISTLLVVAINDYISRTKEKAYEQLVENVEYLTNLYISKERNNISNINTVGTEIYITLQDLVDVDLIKAPIKDPRTDIDITLDEQILIYVLGNNKYYVFFMNRDDQPTSEFVIKDEKGPTIIFNPKINSTYAKTHNVTVTVNDISGVDSSSLKYLWTTSISEPLIENFIDSFTSGQSLNTPADVTGSYYLWVLAKDNENNTTIVRSNVFQLDNESPVITLNGDNPTIVILNEDYIDSGSIAIDNVDGNISNNIIINSTVNINSEGEYTVTYNVSDSLGNEAVPVERTVYVIDPVTEFAYTGSVQTYEPLVTGIYKLEVWGAQGGYYSTTYCVGGKGGYATGEILLGEEDTLSVYVGQYPGKSTSASTVPGGWNGGAIGRYYGGGGGGATDFRINGTTINHRVIVAGGGGGANGRRSSSYVGHGGYGGGTSGGNGTYSTASHNGKGGTQTAGGAKATFSTTGTPANGTFGIGGQAGNYNSSYGAGGGGGGWYGGGGGAGRYGGGGGGSSFVWTAETASNVPGSYLVETKYYLSNANTIAGNVSSMPNPAGGTMTGRTGEGYARITLISVQ